MSDQYANKRKRSQKDNRYVPYKRLLDVDHSSVDRHINTVYVGTIIRLFGTSSNSKGRLATAHWADERGIFVTYDSEQISDFVDLRGKTFVVNHSGVKPGSFQLFTKFGMNDMEDDQSKKTVNEIKQQNRRILMNDTVMKFPTESERNSYQCCLFMLTCNCGYSKRVEKYTCSNNNPENAGKQYFGCKDRYSRSGVGCNFFVWSKELEHNTYKKCKCGKLCKRIQVDINASSSAQRFKFVCPNRSNKYVSGCNTYDDK